MNLVRLACRGAIAWLTWLLCLPASAHAQSDLLLPRQEINQVLAARRSRERQLNSLLDVYGRQLRIEHCVVGKACELGPEGLAALDKLEDELLRRAKENFSHALEGRDANRRVVFSDKRRLVVMNDRVVAVSGAVSAEELRASQASVIEDVDAAVRQSMPASVAERLAAERKRLAEKGRQTQICSLVAAMDETLLLSDKQREKLSRLIGSLWKDAWSSVAIRAEPTSPTPALKSSLTLRAKLRGLGGVFDLPDAALAPLLKPAQRAMWKQLREPLDQELTALQSRLDMAARVRAQGLAAAAGVRRNDVRRGFVMQEFGGVMRAVPLQAVAQGNRRVRFSAEKPKAATKEIPAVKTACFELLLESLGETCSLSPQMREKLKWAGKLDLHRDAARVVKLQEKLQTQLQPAEQERALRELVQVLTPDALLPESDSLLRKAVDSRLTAEQRQRWSEFEERRRQFQRQADVQRQILLCSQRATLTVAQWDAFAELLNDRLDLLPQDRRERRQDEVEIALAQAPDDVLQPLFGEAQWAAIREQLKELRLAHPPAKPAP